MVAKPFSLVIFLLVAAWVVSIFVSGDRLARVNRTCEPIHWTSTLFESIATLAGGKHTPAIHSFFENRFSDCRVVVWNQFYRVDDRTLVTAEGDRP